MKLLLKYLFVLFPIFSFAQGVVRIGTADSTNVYYVNFNPQFNTLNTNTIYLVTFTNSNTSQSITLDPNGPVGATDIKDNTGNDVGIGSIKAGATYTLRYNGTHFRIIENLTPVNSDRTIWDTKTANYIPTAADTLSSPKAFLMESANDVSFTIPSDNTIDFNNGTTFRVQNNSTGRLSIISAPAVSFKCISSAPWTLEQDEYAIASKITDDVWDLTMYKRPGLSTSTTVALYTEYSTIGNITTGEDILFTDTIDGGTLSTDGNSIKGRFSGMHALNDNDKTLRLKFGATTIAERLAANTPTQGQAWVLDYEIIRTSDSTQMINATFNGVDGIANAYFVAGTEDLTADVVLVLTGEATATNDIVKYTAGATFVPGAGSGSTPPPIEPPVIPFITVDNAIKGADGYEHSYTGTWPENLSIDNWFARTLTYSATTNDSVTLRFNGTKVEWFNETAPHLGIAAVSIDGGAETNVDLYAASGSQQNLVWTSPTLTQEEHKIKIRVTGTKNASSSGVYITHDYFKIENNQDVDPEGPPPAGADRFIETAANGGADSGNCSVTPCLTLVYTMTQSVSGDLVQMGPGLFTESNYVSVPLGVSIRGSGIDVTTIAGASNLWDDWDDYDWEYDKALIQFVSGSEQNGNQSIKDLTINGQGTAALDGTGPTHPSALNDRGMYVGISVDFRNNVTIDGVKVRKCFVSGILLQRTRDAKILNCVSIDNAYAQSDFATGAIMWTGSYNEDFEIAGCNVNEGWGYGMKGFGANPATGPHTYDIHGNTVSVFPTGQWSGGSAPNIAFENWNQDMIGAQLHDNYFDGTVSLVNDYQDDDAVNTIHVYNNIIDIMARANGNSYPLEINISYVEIDHNHFNTGRFATIACYAGDTHPYDAPWYGYWNIHHNTTIAGVAVYPTSFLRVEHQGLHEVNLYNNTIEIPYTGSGTASYHLFGVMEASNSSSNVNVKNNVIWGAVSGGTNSLWWVLSGNTFSNVNVTHNDFYNITVNHPAGVTQSNNNTNNPAMNKTGLKPSPFYIPINGGNLNDAGTNVGLPYLGAAPDIGAYEID